MSQASLSAIEIGVHYRLDGECWEWLGSYNKTGYGLAGSDLRPFHYLAHRAVYMAHGHDLEKGIHLHHRCKNTACVNPDHMEALTDRQHFLFHKLVEKTGLTLDDIRTIRRLSSEPGMTAAEVGRRYGIHEITVYNYWGQEQVWADLLGPDEPPVEKPTRTCPQCGSSFNGRNRNAVYCSVECRVRFNSASRKVSA